MTITALEASKCITVEDDELTPLNLGMIASYYYTQYTTIELFAQALAPRIKLKGLIEILASAAAPGLAPDQRARSKGTNIENEDAPERLPKLRQTLAGLPFYL